MPKLFKKLVKNFLSVISNLLGLVFSSPWLGVLLICGIVLLVPFTLVSLNEFNFKWIFGTDLPVWLDLIVSLFTIPLQFVFWILGSILQTFSSIQFPIVK